MYMFIIIVLHSLITHSFYSCIKFSDTLILFCFSDGLVKKLNELEKVADMYKGLIDQTKKLLKSTFELSQSHKGTYCKNP